MGGGLDPALADMMLRHGLTEAEQLQFMCTTTIWLYLEHI